MMTDNMPNILLALDRHDDEWPLDQGAAQESCGSARPVRPNRSQAIDDAAARSGREIEYRKDGRGWQTRMGSAPRGQAACTVDRLESRPGVGAPRFSASAMAAATSGSIAWWSTGAPIRLR
jgi:hypothetical protein